MFNRIPCKQKYWTTYHASIHHDLSSTHLFLYLDGPQIGKDDEQSKHDKKGQGDAFEDPYWPSLKQTVGSVVSWKPAQMALRTAPLSNLPEIRQDHTWNVEHYMMLNQEIWRKQWLNMAQDNCIQWSTFTKNKITSLALEITRCMQFWGYLSMTGAPSYGRLDHQKIGPAPSKWYNHRNWRVQNQPSNSNKNQPSCTPLYCLLLITSVGNMVTSPRESLPI